MFNAKRKKLLERFLILSLFCSSGAVWAQQGTVTLNLNNVTRQRGFGAIEYPDVLFLVAERGRCGFIAKNQPERDERECQ